MLVVVVWRGMSEMYMKQPFEESRVEGGLLENDTGSKQQGGVEVHIPTNQICILLRAA